MSPICHWYVFVGLETLCNHALWCLSTFSYYLWAFVFSPFPVYASFCNPSITGLILSAFLPLPSVPLESLDLLLGFSFPPASAHGSYQMELKYSHFPTPDLEFVVYCHWFWSGGKSFPSWTYYNPGRMENDLVPPIFYLCFCTCRCDLASGSPCSGCDWCYWEILLWKNIFSSIFQLISNACSLLSRQKASPNDLQRYVIYKLCFFFLSFLLFCPIYVAASLIEWWN